MEQEKIKQALRNYIIKEFGVSATDVDFTDDVHLFDYGYVDSFGAVQLVSFGQDTFSIQISQSDLVSYPLNTINEIATFVQLRQRGEL